MTKRRIVFNNNICDGSTHCWFLKDGNCPAKVFQYDADKQIINRLIANLDACIGCENCDGHCPASRLAVEEERFACMSALKDLEVELGVKTEDGLFAEPIINPQLNIYVKDKDLHAGVNMTMEQLNSYPDRLQLIELFYEPICAIATVRYETFYRIISDVLEREIFPCGIDRRVIYTYEDINAVKEFLRVFNIGTKFDSIPLLIVYFNGKVLATWGHGEITHCNFYKYQGSLAEEITNQLRNNNL